MSSELLQRLEDVSFRLNDKEKELNAVQSTNRFLQQDLEACRIELSTAREELHNETTRSSLLEQRMQTCDAELRQVRSQLVQVSAERDALNRTLTVVQDSLRNTSTESHDKGKELNELQVYFNSMLEAKEASINSLQKLLEAQRHTMQEQQQVWEEQRRSLKASLAELAANVPASRAAAAAILATAADQNEASELRARVMALEERCSEEEAKNAKLVSFVKEREKLMSKLQRRLEEGPRGDAGYGARRDVSERDTLRMQAGVASEALQDERVHGERARVRLEGQVSHLAREVEGLSRALEEARTALKIAHAEASETRMRMSSLAREHEDALLRQEQLLMAGAQAAAGGDRRLVEEQMRLSRRIQDLERELRLAQVEAQAASAARQTQVARPAKRAADSSTLDASARKESMLQHSLFVVRANWGTLRKQLLAVQDALGASNGVTRSPTVAYMQGPEFTGRLMREWDISDKPSLDLAVEECFSAGTALLQEASARMQAHVSELTVTRAALGETEDSVKQLRLANSLGQQDAEHRLCMSREEVDELRSALAAARADAGAREDALTQRAGELEMARGRAEALGGQLKRCEEALAAAESERGRLKKVLGRLEGSKSEADAAVRMSEDELSRARHTISDLQATVSLLHERLHTQALHTQAGVEGLKGKLKDVVTVLESPTLQQLHAMMQGGGLGDGMGSGAGALVPLMVGSGVRVGMVPAPQTRAGEAVYSHTQLSQLALGMPMGGSSIHGPANSSVAAQPQLTSTCVSTSLQASVESAIASCSAAVHGLALLEVAHWEADQGAAAVVHVRDQLASARTEMGAGRLTIGEVLINELVAMMDDDAPNRLDVTLLRSKLLAARDVSQHLTKHMKNVEGLLGALRSALPEWLALTSAHVRAGHRSDLSRLRALAGSQLAALRKDLKELKDTCRASLGEMAAYATQTMEKALQTANAVDRERDQAALVLHNMLRDMAVVVTDAAAVPPARMGLMEAVAHAQRLAGLLRGELERLRGSRHDQAYGMADACARGDALQSCMGRLVDTLGSLMTVPPELARGLKDASDATVFSFSLSHLRALLADRLVAVSREGGAAVVAAQVVPLQAQLAALEGQLVQERATQAALKQQVDEYISGTEVALNQCRAAASEQGQAVLDRVLSSVSDEVSRVQSELRDIANCSSEAVKQTATVWGSLLATQRAGAGNAINALEEAAGKLQGQLGIEADAIDKLKEQLEAATREASSKADGDAIRLRELAGEAAGLRARVASLESSEAAVSAELATLRKALRSREASMMDAGLPFEGGSSTSRERDREQDRARERSAGGAAGRDGSAAAGTTLAASSSTGNIHGGGGGGGGGLQRMRGRQLEAEGPSGRASPHKLTTTDGRQSSAFVQSGSLQIRTDMSDDAGPRSPGTGTGAAAAAAAGGVGLGRSRPTSPLAVSSSPHSGVSGLSPRAAAGQGTVPLPAMPGK